MKRFLFTIMALFLFSAFSQAQDRIALVGSAEMIDNVKVIEIGEDYLIYKMYDNLNGPDYRLSLDRVAFVQFENMTVQRINDSGYNQNLVHPYYPDFYEDSPLEYRYGHYYIHDARVDAQIMSQMLGYSLYGDKYRTANLQYFWGMSLTLSGVTILAGTLVTHLMDNAFNSDPSFNDPFFKSNSSSYTALYAVGYVVGAACLGAGIPLWVKGNKKLGEIADDYNRNYGTPRRSPGSGISLNLGPTHSGGLGLSLNF